MTKSSWQGRLVTTLAVLCVVTLVTPARGQDDAPAEAGGTKAATGANAPGEQVVQAVPVERRPIPRGETVISRERPELEPLGGRVGTFLVFPKLRLDGSYDDNIFADDEDEEGDFIGDIIPSLTIQSDWEVHSLRLEADGDIGRYADNTDENFEDYGVGGSGRLDITGQSNLSGEASFRHLHEARESPDDVEGIHPTEYDLITANTEFFQNLGRFNFTVGGAFERFDFDDVQAIIDGTEETIDQDDRDRNEGEGTLRVGYEIVPRYEAFIQGGYNIRRYDTTPDSDGFDRDSEGFEAVAGVEIEFTGITFGEFFAGYRSQEYDDSELDNVEGPAAGAELTWNVTPLTTVVGSLSRTIEETTQEGASGYFATTVALSIDHELLRNVLLNLNGAYNNNDYDGIDRDDNNYRVGAGAKYFLNRYLYLSASYEYRKRDSNVAGQDFDRNLFLVSIETQY